MTSAICYCLSMCIDTLMQKKKITVKTNAFCTVLYVGIWDDEAETVSSLG